MKKLKIISNNIIPMIIEAMKGNRAAEAGLMEYTGKNLKQLQAFYLDKLDDHFKKLI